MREGAYLVRDKQWYEFQKMARIFNATASKAGKKQFKTRIFREVVAPLAERIRAAGAASDGQSRIASRSVKALNRAVPTLSAGAGGSLAAELFYGAEFGGRRRPPVRVARISKKNPPFVIRQTTQQFRPHLGQTGYWFHPTLRSEIPGIIREMQRILMEESGIANILSVGRRR